MNLPYLEIRQTFAQIGLKPYRPPMTIHQPNADMEIRQTHAENIQITNEPGTLTIDQSEAFASINHIPPLKRALQFYAKSIPKIHEYIAKKREEGDRLMKIEDGGNPIAEIAAENSKLTNSEVVYRLLPKPLSVKIHYEPGEFRVDVKPDRIDIKVKKNEPEITIPKWQTEVYLRQKNSLTIRAVGLYVDRNL